MAQIVENDGRGQLVRRALGASNRLDRLPNNFENEHCSRLNKSQTVSRLDTAYERCRAFDPANDIFQYLPVAARRFTNMFLIRRPMGVVGIGRGVEPGGDFPKLTN